MIAALFVMLASLWSVAHGAQLAASVPLKELTVGQTVELEVQLTDGDPDGLPDVPHGPGLSVSYRNQAQSVVSVNFQTTRIVRYTYTLTALSEGIHQLGPITQQTGGHTLTVDAARIKVAERSAAQKRAHDLQVTLSEPSPYVGQVALYHLQYTRSEDIQGRSFELPDFDGFLQDKSIEPQGREYRVEDGGRSTMVEEFWVPLVASGQGERTISPALLTIQIPEPRARRDRRFDPFFDRTPLRTERVASTPLQPTVRPLPTAGRPADFTGLVGTFALSAKPTARQVTLGGSVTVEVQLTGAGSLAGFALPPLPPDSGLRAYDDAPEISASVDNGRYIGAFTQRRAVVPEREGTVTLPEIALAVFDPAQDAYVVLRTQPVEIAVLPGDAAGDVASFAGGDLDRRRDVEALGDDILPAPGDASVRDRTLAATWPIGAALTGLPLLLWVGLLAQRRVTVRPANPKADLAARMATLPSDPVARLSVLEAVFRDSAGLRLGVPGPAVDRAGVASLGDEALRLYADLDAARYGGANIADIEPRVAQFVAEAA